MSTPDKPQDERGRGPAWLRRWRASRHEARKRHVRERALATLKQSLREAGSQLNLDWVREDPDFATFAGDREFEDIVPSRTTEKPAARWKPDKPRPKEVGALPIPPRPWGSAVVRWRFWLTVAVLSFGADIVLLLMFAEFDGLILIASVILAVAAWRAAQARSDRRLYQYFAPR
jgi:hypothetical protein